jgi:hypothetical protein
MQFGLNYFIFTNSGHPDSFKNIMTKSGQTIGPEPFHCQSPASARCQFLSLRLQNQQRRRCG